MRNYESILLFGDFNDTCSVWELDHNASDLGLKLYDLINSTDLHQMVHEPTHIDPPAANILDLLITDSPGYIINQNIFPPLGSKHQVVYTDFKIQYKCDKPFTRHIWDYTKGNYNQLQNELNEVPWGVGPNSFDDIDNMTEFWQRSFMQVCKKNIPNRLIKIRPMDKPLLTHEVKVSLRRRNRLFSQFKLKDQETQFMKQSGKMQ
jgi:hypothetical protein